MTGVDSIAPVGLTGYWALDVYPDACAGPRVVSLEGNTVPPPVLELPVSLLPKELVAGHIFVQGRLEQDASSPQGVYEILIRSGFASCIPFRVVP